ncbi:MAG: hypothetical protein RI907_19 [Pseudomonadota bacterium]|jgi:monoamine oxidase
MLDVAIVGGGLCGLALAHSLQAAKGLNWALFEARDRLGGRVLTARSPAGTPVDLGATWFWPGHQPNVTRLVEALGLATLPQPDDGRVLHLHDATQPPRLAALQADQRLSEDEHAPAHPRAVHGGAMRVVGGTDALIRAIARPLPVARLNLAHRLLTVHDQGDHVVLTFSHQGQTRQVLAKRVVLAAPPRVLHTSVGFEPALAPDLQAAMRDTPTWMATAAKAGQVFRHAFWREAGLTGNAWVTHAQAMLSETFDACGPDEPARAYPEAALAGFAALPAAQRPAFERGRPLLLESQVVQLFGEAAAHPDELVASFWQDWATEDSTCTALDIAQEQAGAVDHPAYGLPVFAEPCWRGRLLWGSTETAQRGGGYLEGALGAAARLRKQLLSDAPAQSRPRDAANDAGVPA